MNNKIIVINGELFIKNKFKIGNIFIENNKIKKITFKKIDKNNFKDYKII